MNGAAAAVKRGLAGRLKTRAMRGVEIGETGYRGVELQFDGAGRTVALFADDHLGLAIDAFTFGQP
jgi:hypothetical protein